MAEAKSQVVRRALIQVVASYDPSVVNKNALTDSKEFGEFLAKDITAGNIDSLAIVEIELELEDLLDVELPDQQFHSWQQLFEKLVALMNGE